MFRRLTRHFAAGLVDNDLIADGQDLHQSIAGILAAFLVASGCVALMFLGKYNSVVTFVRGKPSALFQTLADKQAMALDDKTLLIGGAMILMGLLTAVFWDALALDERDLSVMGPLPVRPAMVLAAKAAAVTRAAALVAIALNALPALLFPIVVLAKAPVGLLDVLRGMAAHAVGGLAACAFVFFTLSSLRGVAGLFRSGSVARRLLPLAQFALILGLLSVLFALPVLAGKTRPAIEAGSASLIFYPPLWFLGLEEVLIGRTEAVFTGLARAGLIALAASIAGTVLVHTCALFLRSHRTGAGAGSPTSATGRLISTFIDRLARVLSADGRVRASFVFAARTVTRSPRHRLYLAGSLGVGFAVAGATLASAAAGLGALNLKYMGLAAQLNLVFFLVVGLRMAATIPADLDGGWIFRYLATPARTRHVAGTRAAIFFLVVLPLLVLLAPLHAWLWGWYTAVVHFAFGVVAALGLLEIVFTEYVRMPFVSAFTPGRAVLGARFGLYLIDYGLFAYVTPGIEQFLIDRTALFYTWVGLFVIVVGRFINSVRRPVRRDEMPVFDEPAVEMEQLGLWNTVHSKAAATYGEPASRSSATDLFEGVGRDRESRSSAPSRSWRAEAGQLWLDVVYAQRRLRANPGFTAFSVLTLALGIGATTALYSVIYSTILRPLNVRELDRLANIYHADPMRGSPAFWTMSLPDFEDLRRTQTVFTGIAAHAPFAQIVIANGVGEKARGETVTGEYFSLLGLQPSAGRLLQPADDRPGAPPVAVIDERMWRRRFDARPDIAGQTIRMAGRDFEIVGVAPPDFHGVVLPNLAPTGVWVPLQAAMLIGGYFANLDGNRDQRWLLVQGRLAPGRTVDQAQTELRVIGRQLDEAFPIGRDLPRNQRSPPYVSRPWVALPAADRLVTEGAEQPRMVRMARLTMVAVILVLLVACTNLANLTLARGVSRRRELAVRLALGASRWQVIREQLVESAILSALGVLATLAAARVLTVFGSNLTIRLGAWVSVDVAPTLDLPVAVVGVVSTLLALVVFGLVPALQLTSGDTSLVGASAGGNAGTRWRGRRLLIASQVAVSVALVAIASLCARHVVTAASRDTGLDLDRLALVRFDFKVQGWDEARARRAVERIADDARREGGTEAVAIVSGLPLYRLGRSASLTTPDRPFGPKYSGQNPTWIAASSSVFRTLGIPILSGRSFDERDTVASTAVIVLSEQAARGLFDTADAVGRQVLRRRPPVDGRAAGVDTLTVIGVAADTNSGDGGAGQGAAYAPFSQNYEPSLTIAARTALDAKAAVLALETLTHRLEPELGVIDAGTGTALSGVENLAFEVMGALSGLLGFLAMALAMAGLYGVLSYVVAQRTHEIGVRVALGASARQIMRLILADGVRPVVEGLVVGFVIADLAEMAMRPALAKPLPAIDATLMVLVPLPFLIAALVACYLPSRRAASVDPNVALRHT
jgi:putative ABC transport system permease protein